MPRTRPSDPSQAPIYIAFPDGVFDYVCAECTAICCKGLGFGGSLKKEVRSLFVLYPALESATMSRHGDQIEFVTPRGGCFFLDSDNLCRIEKEHGRALKPNVCTLFPFNVLRRLGDAVVVAPNFLCPIRLRVPARPGEVEGSHDRVESAVRERLATTKALPQRTIAATGGARQLRAILAQEMAFRDACAEALTRTKFAELLSRSASDPETLAGFQRRVSTLLGVPHSTVAARDELDDLLLAVAPVLRLDYLKLSGDGVLRALATAEFIARRLAFLADRSYAPHELAQMLATYRQAILLLGQGDDPVNAHRAMNTVPPFGDASLTFAAFAALRGLASGKGPLESLEQAVPTTMAISDRMALVVALGGQLESALNHRAFRKQ